MSRPTRVAGVLAILFLALHLPFLPASLEDLDSVNFALGIRDFNVAEHQPHPPGYPIFMAAAKALHLLVPSEVRVLSLLSVLAGALGILAMSVFFRRLDRGGRPGPVVLATVLATTAPLYWVTAARPLSDLPGLAAALGIQALMLGGGPNVAAAAYLAGLGGGIRSQVLWLTAPLLAWIVVRSGKAELTRNALRTAGLVAAGVLTWLVPMVLVEGGPAAYWHALWSQGAEDLSGVQMLWTNRTPRQVLLVLDNTLLAPWGSPFLAGAIITLALIGCGALMWRGRPQLATLVAAFGPYLAFDVLFQESITTRYALPLVVPMAYLAVRGTLVLPRFASAAVVLAAAGASAFIAQLSLQQYARLEAPAFRLLRDMRTVSASLGGSPVVLAAHRREDLNFRRPIRWAGKELPAMDARLSAPPKHEWLEAVKYWNGGGLLPVWFIADPLRSDLALFDRSAPPRTYRWPLTYPALVGGARPNEMDWHIFGRPGWFLGEGWALTPESAGVALEDRRGPGLTPSQGWIRRRSDPATLMIGGRNLGSGGGGASITLSIDGRAIDQAPLPPGFFLRFLTLPQGALAGPGDYAPIQVAASGDVAIEQFDVQSADRVVFGFGEGWHEREYDPISGRLWRWMSERGTIRVRGTGRAHVLTVSGVTEAFSQPSQVVVRAGDRRLAETSAGSSFSFTALIPAELMTAAEQLITIETDQVYIPAEQSSRTQDRRHLGLKILDCRLDEATPSSGLSRETQQGAANRAVERPEPVALHAQGRGQ